MSAVNDGRPMWSSRVKKAAVFIAIVWTVAGSLVIFELVALRGVDTALAHPAFDGVTLANATEESVSCRLTSDERARAAALTSANEKVAIWLLGLNTGRDAVARQWNDPDPATLDSLDQSSRQLAEALGVAAPDRFRPHRLAEANTEFIAYVESSAHHTARQLALRYTGDACELYKLGAFWGYSTLVRAALSGERAVFGPEIRHHAAAFGLPEPLYLPVTLRTPADRSGEQLAEESMAFTQAVTAHLSR